jgi:hypothetical protein
MLTKGIPVTTASITEENLLFEKVSPNRYAKNLLQGNYSIKENNQIAEIGELSQSEWEHKRFGRIENSERRFQREIVRPCVHRRQIVERQFVVTMCSIGLNGRVYTGNDTTKQCLRVAEGYNIVTTFLSYE